MFIKISPRSKIEQEKIVYFLINGNHFALTELGKERLKQSSTFFVNFFSGKIYSYVPSRFFDKNREIKTLEEVISHYVESKLNIHAKSYLSS